MYLVIDIGGTKTLVAVFSKTGRVVRKIKFPTAAQAEQFLGDLDGVLREFVKYNVVAVATAIPGTVRENRGAEAELNKYFVHFGKRDWDGINIYGCIKKLFNVPIHFENDANLAAVYESWRRPGRTVFLTFSTGLGGGVAENGRLVPEFSLYEPGRKEYEYKGVRDQWQNIAACSAIEKAFGVPRATDLRGEAAMQEVASRVALGLHDVISATKPRRIVLGGPLGKIFRQYAKYLPEFKVRFVRPRRPNESVIYGGWTFLCKEKSNKRNLVRKQKQK